MYKCKECGTEYEIKPDYCDCGNNEFVITLEEKSDAIAVKQSEIKTAETDSKAETEVYTHTKQFNNSEYKKSFTSTVPKAAPLSLSIFILCLMLSFVIVFVWNPKEKDAAIETKTDSVINTNIPSIDKIWKVSKEQTQIQQKNQEPTVKAELAKVPLPKAVQTVKNIQAVTKPTKPTQVNVKKIPAAQKTITKKTQTAKLQTQTTAATATVKPQTSPIDIEAKKAAEEARKKIEEVQRKDAEEKKAAEEKQANQEYLIYKINLRNAIGRKIDFAKVIGDGDCLITFKLDSNGKLVNRLFAKKSTNMTLNEAVYNAIIAIPSYSPPPKAYENETLRLNIKFYNGNFEITLN